MLLKEEKNHLSANYFFVSRISRKHICFFITCYRHVFHFLRYSKQLVYYTICSTIPMFLLTKCKWFWGTRFITIYVQSVIVMNWLQPDENTSYMCLVAELKMFSKNATIYILFCYISLLQIKQEWNKLWLKSNILIFVHVNKYTLNFVIQWLQSYLV